MFRSTAIMGAACLGLAAVSGCSLLSRAVKGELTPVGVEQATASDVSALQNALAEFDEPGAWNAAFTDLASVYLYKCLESPTRAPREGKAEIRARAGEALVTGLKQRVASHTLAGDPVPSGGGAKAAALHKEITTKCDAAKLGKLDPKGFFAQAVELTQAPGRDAYVKVTAGTLDGELQTALGADDRAVLTWASRTCPDALPDWEYCVPRAVEGLYSARRWDSIVRVFLQMNDDKAEQILPALGEKIGKDQLVTEVRDYLLGGEPPPGATRGLDRVAGFLAANGAWGTCEDRQPLFTAALKGDDPVVATWALDKVVADKCSNIDRAIVQALGSNSPGIREKAAWTVGELNIQSGKKHIQRLQWSDPYLNEGCWCHPVRNAAKNAYNKLEIAKD